MSAARAASITKMLEDFGVTQQRLSIKANGSNKPIATNETEIGRAKNRRVVIALSKFSYLPKANENSINQSRKVLQQKLSDSIEGKVPDYEKITVVPLPSGGVRITTRRESIDGTEN